MRALFFVLAIFITSEAAYCQPVPVWKMGASTGWGRSAASDLLLNHYNYSGNTFLNFKVFASRHKVKQRFDFQFTFNTTELYPDNLNQLFYEYNYLERSGGELSISYLQVVMARKNIQVSVGGCNASFYAVQDEFHRNVLYPYGLDHRKSYVISPLNLIPLLSVDYTAGKSALNGMLGYTIVNVSGRPDDNYVKQIGIDHGRSWNLHFPDQFSGFRYSFQYQYTFRKTSLTLTYEGIYNSIDGERGFRSLQRMLLAGVIISR